MSCSDCISNEAGSYAFFESLRKAEGDQLLPLTGSIELTGDVLYMVMEGAEGQSDVFR